MSLVKLIPHFESPIRQRDVIRMLKICPTNDPGPAMRATFVVSGAKAIQSKHFPAVKSSRSQCSAANPAKPNHDTIVMIRVFCQETPADIRLIQAVRIQPSILKPCQQSDKPTTGFRCEEITSWKGCSKRSHYRFEQKRICWQTRDETKALRLFGCAVAFDWAR